MAQYVPTPASTDPAKVGTLYHLALSDGVNTYGYILQNRGGTDDRSALNESTNITDREKLIQISSPNLIDQHLVVYPRVSQGDYSGGLLQTVFIDPTRAFDSDLEVRTPGYLILRPAWQRRQLTTGLGAVVPQSVPWNGDVYTTFQGSTYWDSHGNAFTGAGITVKYIDTDGTSLLISDGVNTIEYTIENVAYTVMTTTAGPHTQIWHAALGTNGRRLYFTNDRDLFYIDENAALPTAPVSVPTGRTQFHVKDLVPYQNGVAILTTDATPGVGMDVWFHDGSNMTRIVRIQGYAATGMCVCLGNLYVTAQSIGQFEPPALIKVTTSSFEVVARIGSPITSFTTADIGAPVSSGQYVYFALTSPQINNVTTVNYIAVYDTITGAYSHLGAMDATDAPQAAQPRQLAPSGRAVTFPMVVAGVGSLQMQTDSSRLGTTGSPVPLFTSSGWMVSSKLDFGTPGVAKRFRRVEVHHTPLLAGETITVNCYVDLDPLSFTTTLPPRPSTATVTNSTVGTDVTVLTLGNDPTPTGTNVGRSIIYAVRLGAGTNQQTTPKVIYAAVEVGGTWVWDLDLDCTSSRRLLNGSNDDPQGVNGKDLYYLIRNAYENGTPLTLTLAGPTSYAVNIESVKGQVFGYVHHAGTTVNADEEWLVHLTLRQEAS
jgi:hypothetical protein